MRAKPTEPRDLRRIRTHDWVNTGDIFVQCHSCGVRFSNNVAMRDLPACPGGGYILMTRDDARWKGGAL